MTSLGIPRAARTDDFDVVVPHGLPEFIGDNAAVLSCIFPLGIQDL